MTRRALYALGIALLAFFTTTLAYASTTSSTPPGIRGGEDTRHSGEGALVLDPVHDLAVHGAYVIAPSDSIDIVAVESTPLADDTTTLRVVDVERRGGEDDALTSRNHHVRFYGVWMAYGDTIIRTVYIKVEPSATDIPEGFYAYIVQGGTEEDLAVTGSVQDDTIRWRHEPGRGAVTNMAALTMFFSCDAASDCDPPALTQAVGPFPFSVPIMTLDVAPETSANNFLATVTPPVWWNDVFPVKPAASLATPLLG